MIISTEESRTHQRVSKHLKRHQPLTSEERRSLWGSGFVATSLLNESSSFPGEMATAETCIVLVSKQPKLLRERISSCRDGYEGIAGQVFNRSDVNHKNGGSMRIVFEPRAQQFTEHKIFRILCEEMASQTFSDAVCIRLLSEEEVEMRCPGGRFSAVVKLASLDKKCVARVVQILRESVV